MWSRARRILAGGGLTAVLLASGTAHANLVTNGGFETGDFNGWTQTLDALYDGVGDNTVLTVQAGTYSAYLGGANSSISQTLTTVAGAKYVLSFWLAAEDFLGFVTPNDFSVDLGGATVMSLTDAPATGYNLYEIGFIASSASTNLTLNFSQGASYWDLDSVNVTLPEPGSIALLAVAGLGGFAASRRRKATGATA